MDPDQTAPKKRSDLGPHCLSMRLPMVKWTTKTYILWLCALRVYKCEFSDSVYTVRISMKCTLVCAAQKALPNYK